MSRRSPYPKELRERAVRMVAEIRPHYETEWAAIGAVAAKLGWAPQRRSASGCGRPRAMPGNGRVRRARSPLRSSGYGRR
jgi:hypothetical protein